MATNDDWLALVERGLQAIQEGEFAKIVPARRSKVRGQRPPSAHRLLSALACLYPSSILFAVDLGNGAFSSATPERLISVYGGRVGVDALAGTIRRADTEAADEALAQALLTDEKSLLEHRLVIDSITNALAPVCRELPTRTPLRTVKLRNLQHIKSTLSFECEPGLGLLHLAQRLHPTAAVCGEPRSTLNWLRHNEPFARGWFSGAGGWVDDRGEGELAVLLRCSLLNADQATLYSGAGVVSGSRPESEFEEIELKFRGMLEALENA